MSVWDRFFRKKRKPRVAAGDEHHQVRPAQTLQAALHELPTAYKDAKGETVLSLLSEIERWGESAKPAAEVLLSLLQQADLEIREEGDALVPRGGEMTLERHSFEVSAHMAMLDVLERIGVPAELESVAEEVLLARFAKELSPNNEPEVQRYAAKVRRLLCRVGGMRSLATVLRQTEGEHYFLQVDNTKALVGRVGADNALAALHEVLVGERQGNKWDVRLAADLLAEIGNPESISLLQSARSRCYGVCADVVERTIEVLKGRYAEVSCENAGVQPAYAAACMAFGCPRCGYRIDRAPSWPRNGNSVAFYAQPDLNPSGKYHLELVCSSCAGKVFVVWDEDPR